MKKLVYFYTLLYLYSHVMAKDKRKNVLLLISDDMRPNFNCYEGENFPSSVHSKMHTPHIDAFAKESLLLKRAYVQYSLCGPSRNSFLTSRRPDTLLCYGLGDYFREQGGKNIITLPQYFMKNGYKALSLGKVFHGCGETHEDKYSFSENCFTASSDPSCKIEALYDNCAAAIDKESLEDECLLGDEILTKVAQEKLKELKPKAKSGEQPFFLALGWARPHTYWYYPKEFEDYYPLDEIGLPDNPYIPSGTDPIAVGNYGPISSCAAKDHMKISKFAVNVTLPSHLTKKYRRAYYSCVSFIDHLLGQIMKTLKELDLERDTVVCFISDHGYHLGENGHWMKITNFELGVHAHFILKVPGKTDQGISTDALAEYVDLFPTLVDAAGLPQIPLCPEKNSQKTHLCREGMSLMPLIEDPKGKHWKKDAAFSQVNHSGRMGYTMRTDQYRYTEWPKHKGNKDSVDWDDVSAVELYDHKIDPFENVNRAEDPKYHDIRQKLSEKLRAGWRAVNM